MTHRQRDHPDKGAAVAGLRVHPTPPLPAGTSPNEPAAGLSVPRGTFSSAAAGADLLTGGALQPGQCHPPATADPATVRLNTPGRPTTDHPLSRSRGATHRPRLTMRNRQDPSHKPVVTTISRVT